MIRKYHITLADSEVENALKEVEAREKFRKFKWREWVELTESGQMFENIIYSLDRMFSIKIWVLMKII